MATRKALKPAAAESQATKTRRRVLVDDDAADGQRVSYFAAGGDKQGMQFVSTGCMVIDEALGGGAVLGRVINVVGDKSAGKTLLAMELVANFRKAYPDGWIRYAESEAAFDKPYAAALGIPTDDIIFNDEDKLLETVEDLYDDMLAQLTLHEKKPCGLYIIDSLDALSDDAEQERDFSEGSYGGAKPKAIGKLFRMLVNRLQQQQVLFVVISQIRDKLNVRFGDTKTRSGGRALDFYASQIVWLVETGKQKKTIGGVERVVGIDVEATVKKNKIGLPFRKAAYPVLFGYGIDDLTSGVEWLIENKREARLEELGLSKSGYKVKINSLRNTGGAEVREMRDKLAKIIRVEWSKIEESFLSKSSKY